MTQRTESPAADWLTPGEAAAIASVTVRTLQRYGDAGRVLCKRLPSGHRRYERRSVEGLLSTAST